MNKKFDPPNFYNVRKAINDWNRSMRQKDYKAWLKYSDFKYKRKRIKDFVIELYYGTDRGAEMIIWEMGPSELEHVWPSSDDKKYHIFGEFHWMNFRNGIDAYENINTTSELTDFVYWHS